MDAFGIMKLPGRTIVSVPIIGAITLLCCFWLATTVFAQTPTASPSDSEDLFTWIGRVVVIIALIVIATAAVYNTIRKAALNEYKELAEARKGKLVESELDKAYLKARVKELETENESLEKKNLRLQDEKRG